MTAAGKSLKEVYDAGSERLLEMEKESTHRLGVRSQQHAEARKDHDIAAIKQVEGHSGELGSELETFLKASVDRLQKVVETELRDTEDHLLTVKADLSNLSDRLKNSIIELRKAYEENVETLQMSLADGYEGVVESSTMELEKQDFASSKHVRAHGTVVMNSLQQKLDHSLWESRGEEKQYNSSLFKAFMQKANSIDAHFSTLMQRLSSDFQGHFKIVQNQAGQAEPELSRVSQELASEIDGYATQIENDVRQLFHTVLEEHSHKLDNSLSAVAQDLSSVHDGTTEHLSDQTRELSDSFVTASGDARTVLSNRCDNLRQQIETMSDKFNSRLEEKLSGSHVLRTNLDTEKQAIFQQVRKDLDDIRENFEKRMSNLMTEAVERVGGVTEEAEEEIEEVFNRSNAELQRDGLFAKAEIERSVAGLLQLLAEHRKNALDLIARSAGGGAETTDSAASPPAPQSASPTNFDFPDDLDF